MAEKNTSKQITEVPAISSIEATMIDAKIQKYQDQLKTLLAQEGDLNKEHQRLEMQLTLNHDMQQRHDGAIIILNELKAEILTIDDAERV